MRARYSRTRNFLSDPLRPYSRLTLKNRSRENGSYRRRRAARVAAWAARSWWAASFGGPAGRTRCRLWVGDMWVMAGVPWLGGRGASSRRGRERRQGADSEATGGVRSGIDLPRLAACRRGSLHRSSRSPPVVGESVVSDGDVSMVGEGRRRVVVWEAALCGRAYVEARTRRGRCDRWPGLVSSN